MKIFTKEMTTFLPVVIHGKQIHALVVEDANAGYKEFSKNLHYKNTTHSVQMKYLIAYSNERTTAINKASLAC